MKRGYVVLGLALLLAGGVYALDAGVGPFGDGAGDEDVSGFPDAPGGGSHGAGTDGDGDGAATDGGTGGTSGGSTDPATADDGAEPAPAFGFEILAIEQCGRTCRDVTAAIHNTGDADAADVTVYSRIYAGNSTASDDRVWSDERAVGTLPAGASDEATRRVELSLSEGFAIRNAGGWITVLTQVRGADTGVVTFQDRYQVG